MALFIESQVLRAAFPDVSGRTMASLNASAERSFRLLQIESEVPDAADESGRAIGAKTFDIFLSHSSLDASLVLGVYRVLTGRGYSVYLDRIHDKHLDRRKVSRQTAQTIRRRMTQCNSLFVATTQNTTSSNWVPWELGFTDGLTGNAVILPIVESADSQFGGLTYFELYPIVEDRSGKRKPDDLEIVDRTVRSTWGSWIQKPKSY